MNDIRIRVSDGSSREHPSLLNYTYAQPALRISSTK